MTLQTTFYLSQIIGNKCCSPQGTVLGKLMDFLIDQATPPGNEPEPVRPKVLAVKIKKGRNQKIFDFASFEIK